MRARFESAGERLILAFDDVEAVAAFLDGAKSQEGFLAPLPAEATAGGRGRELTVALEAPGGFEMSFRAAVLHVFGPTGAGQDGEVSAALERIDWGPARDAEARRKLAAARSGAGERSEVQGESLGASPIYRIQKMTPPEKARLARKANRTERQILLRETSPQVTMALLTNPHIEGDDVVQIVKSPYTPGGVLKRIAADRRWLSNPDVRQALVRNPQTPTPLAIRLLPGLPTPVLQVLARGGEAREDLKKAALKLYLKRTGK